MKRLYDLIVLNEEWLMEQVLKYAKKHHYVRYTSTLLEAWRISIAGLSKTILDAILISGEIRELSPDENFMQDPIAAFGILEAQRHRARGVDFVMYLGLIKYYRKSYIDLVRQAGYEPDYEEYCRLFIDRIFDRLEIGFSLEWMKSPESKIFKEMQAANRKLTNEKNKYLTIFESLPNPVILLNMDFSIEDLNFAAAELLQGVHSPGANYYSKENKKENLQWLEDDLKRFLLSNNKDVSYEKKLETFEGIRYFDIMLARMLDISEKYSGVLIYLKDITERKKLQEILQDLSYLDGLTSVSNRRHFDEIIDNEWNRLLREGKLLSLIFIDVDYFKNYNDTYGHLSGDECLKQIAKIISSNLKRPGDLVARYGGEEFAVILPNTDLNGATFIAEKLRSEVESEGILHTSSTVSNCVTISLGVSTMVPSSNFSTSHLINAADRALYQAKKDGRNRIKVVLVEGSINNPVQRAKSQKAEKVLDN